MTTLRIAQIVQHLAPGGIETMVLDLQKKASAPEQVHIISLEGTFEKASAHWPRIKNTPRLHFLKKPPGLSLKAVKQLADLLKQLNISVVHTHHVGPLLYGGLAAKLAGCQHVHTEHDAWHLANPKRRLLVGACFHLLRPRVAADAKLVAQNIRQHIPLFTPSVILNGIDTELFCPGDQSQARELLALPKDKQIIGCAGRFTAVKSQHLLIEALAALPEAAHLALAGGGELEQDLRHQVQQANLEDRVHFVGVVEHMPDFYRAIDLFCMTSQREGLPLSPLEAQACERAALLTDVGGCLEAVDPESGLLVPYGDAQALQQALNTLLQTGLTSEARASARQFVLKNGDLQRMIHQYEQLYQGSTL